MNLSLTILEAVLISPIGDCVNNVAEIISPDAIFTIWIESLEIVTKLSIYLYESIISEFALNQSKSPLSLFNEEII